MSTQIDIGKIVAGLNRVVEETTSTIAIEITAELQEATPVDTSFARSSWIPSVGAPSAEMGGSPEAPNAAAAEAGLARVASFRLSDGRAYVSNNARYIRKLDTGWSKQAPADFVLASIKRGLQVAIDVLRSSPTLGSLRARVLGAG